MMQVNIYSDDMRNVLNEVSKRFGKRFLQCTLVFHSAFPV